jgi:hypothetical protein
MGAGDIEQLLQLLRLTAIDPREQSGRDRGQLCVNEYQWLYHHYDARGHCILLTSPNGTLLEQYDYDAFGSPYFPQCDWIGWGNHDAGGTLLAE